MAESITAGELESWLGDGDELALLDVREEGVFGRGHLLLGGPIALACPVRLLQGMADRDVPWRTALKLAEALAGDDVEVTLIKGGDHRLSEAHDLERLCRALDGLIEGIGG